MKKHDGTDYNEDVSHTVVPTSLDDKTKLTIGLGNISGKYKVEIVTRVTNVANANKEIPYNNSATIRGTEKPGGIVSNNYGVTIGVPSIRKSAGTYDVLEFPQIANERHVNLTPVPIYRFLKCIRVALHGLEAH